MTTPLLQPGKSSSAKILNANMVPDANTKAPPDKMAGWQRVDRAAVPPSSRP